jgi:hypothetical protein
MLKFDFLGLMVDQFQFHERISIKGFSIIFPEGMNSIGFRKCGIHFGKHARGLRTVVPVL